MHLCILLIWPCIGRSDSQKPDHNNLVSLAVVWNYSLFLLFAMPYETWGQCEYVSRTASGTHCIKTQRVYNEQYSKKKKTK